MKELWVEKYRPKTVKEYVVRDETQKKQIESWVSEKSIPHLLFHGSPGTGKTTLAKVLLNELEVSSYDILHINAARETGVDEVRDKITRFIQIRLENTSYWSNSPSFTAHSVTELLILKFIHMIYEYR